VQIGHMILVSLWWWEAVEGERRGRVSGLLLFQGDCVWDSDADDAHCRVTLRSWSVSATAWDIIRTVRSIWPT